MVTSRPATDLETAGVNSSISGLGVKVVSGMLYLTGMDMPGDDPDELERYGAGNAIACEPGDYDVELRAIGTRPLYDTIGKEIDFVIRLAPRITAFKPLEAEPRLLWHYD